MRWARRLGIGIGAMVAAALLLVAGAGWLAGRKERAVSDDWRATVEPVDDLLERFPDAEANATAREIAQSAAGVGIELLREEGDPVAREDERAAMEAVRGILRVHLDRQNERPGDTIDELPPELRAFLDSRGSTLDAIRDRLVAGPAPSWDRRLSLFLSAPVPELRGLVDLQGLLLARALDASRAGRSGEAAREAEASWQLNATVRERPELISQIIAITICRMQAATLRKLDGLPSAWEPRLLEHDYRKSLLTSFAAEAWTTSEAFDAGSQLPDPPVGLWLVRPYFRMQAVDYLEKRRRVVKEMAALDPCRRDDAAMARIHAIEPASWNTMGRIAWPEMSSTFPRVVRLIWSLDLTRKVVVARAARAAGGGAWPAEIPGIESSPCSDNPWIYETTPGGGMRLSLGKEIAWEEPASKGPSAPFVFEGSPPSEAAPAP